MYACSSMQEQVLEVRVSEECAEASAGEHAVQKYEL